MKTEIIEIEGKAYKCLFSRLRTRQIHNKINSTNIPTNQIVAYFQIFKKKHVAKNDFDEKNVISKVRLRLFIYRNIEWNMQWIFDPP